jgi:valyl-tRNA synthetase
MAKQEQYDPVKQEKKWLKYWKAKKIYKFKLDSKKKPYSIDTPPPYVSGRMHIGHAFSYSQQDFIARFQRMKTGNVFYPFGTDDNGLPTERFVEKQNKLDSKSMSRADFIKLCLKTLKEQTPQFVQDWRDLGISCDFENTYSTIDDNSRKISQKSFIGLYKDKQIYLEQFPTLWCVKCQTPIAQAELEDSPKQTQFNTLKFEVPESKKELQIATTRPELLPACVAVFVNPKDKRYKNLIGKKAKIPLFNHEVPIIADESADMEKGTGALMVCSYGDKYDVEAITRHKLNPNVVFNKNGTLNHEKYEGLKIKQAREQIIQDLKENDFVSNQEQISNVVNVHDKCGTPIEFLPTEQWFIKILDKKKQLIAQAKKINWKPEFMRKRYENWVNGLEWDWSISRNRHFGIPIPVWKCEECNEIIFPLEKELPIDPLETKKNCPKCKKQAKGEDKVLDTWATSSLSPQIASSLVNNKVKIPFSLRPQAHDIIRTWAFYTITKAYLHENQIPWNDIMISGFVTLGGEKMSKSKGNVIVPKDVMDIFGADALRFWAAGSKLGEDLGYQEKDLVTGKKTITKLWNASRFVFMNLEDYDGKKPKKLETIDEEFLKTLDYFVKNITGSFERYNYSVAKQGIEKFFWNYFTDNYLEIVKKIIYQNKKGKQSAQYTLHKTLLTLLKLFAPIMPFITEEIYQTYFKKTEKEESIHLSEWPEYDQNAKPSDYLDAFISYLSSVRQEKTRLKLPMNSEIILTMDKDYLKNLEEWDMVEHFKDVTNAKEIKTGKFKVEFISD